MWNPKGQGQRREPDDSRSNIESTCVEKCLNSEILINDEIPVPVIVPVIVITDSSDSSDSFPIVKFSTSVHPTTCQTNQLTIGHPQTPNIWSHFRKTNQQ